MRRIPAFLLALALASVAGPASAQLGGTLDLRTRLPIPGASARRTLTDKLADQLSVLDFGAVCDGLTDDSAAVNAAVQSGKTVLVPSGRVCTAPNVPMAALSTSALEGGGTIAAVGGSYVTPTTAVASQAALAAIPKASQGQPDGVAALGPTGSLIGTAAPDPHDAREFGAFGDGIFDNSARLTTLCQTAANQGQRYVMIPAGTYLAPNLVPNACPNTILIGQGVLQPGGGTPRKIVIPATAPPAIPPGNTIPASALKHWLAAIAAASPASPALVCIWGDSTGTVVANSVVSSESLWLKLQAKIIADNPGVPIAFRNFAIGGGTFAVMAGRVAPPAYPSWFIDHAASWASYLQGAAAGGTAGCDLDIIDSGMNDSGTLAQGDVDAALNLATAGTKQPSIVLVTNGVPSLQALAPGYSDVASQDGRDYAAGFIRSYALFHGFGLLDDHRRMVQVRDGFDLIDQPLVVAAQEATFISGAWNAPILTYDFGLRVDLPYGLQSGATTGIIIPLSSGPSNAVVLDRDSGGTLAFTIYTDASHPSVTRTVTSVAIPAAGYFGVELVAKGGFVTLAIRPSLPADYQMVFAGYVPRFGARFQPTIAGTGTPMIRSSLLFAASKPRVVMPLLTDAEMYGAALNGTDGNALNHGTSAKIEAVDAVVVAAGRFGP